MKIKCCNTKTTQHVPFHRLPYVCHPCVSFFLGGGVDLVHLWFIRGSTDQKHGLLIVGHFPDYQLLKRDHRRLVVLGG